MSNGTTGRFGYLHIITHHLFEQKQLYLCWQATAKMDIMQHTTFGIHVNTFQALQSPSLGTYLQVWFYIMLEVWPKYLMWSQYSHAIICAVNLFTDELLKFFQVEMSHGRYYSPQSRCATWVRSAQYCRKYWRTSLPNIWTPSSNCILPSWTCFNVLTCPVWMLSKVSMVKSTGS